MPAVQRDAEVAVTQGLDDLAVEFDLLFFLGNGASMIACRSLSNKGSLIIVTVRVRLFAGLRERAGWSEREDDVARFGRLAGARSRSRAARAPLRGQQGVRGRRAGARGRGRGRAHPAGLRRRVPADCRAALDRGRRRGGPHRRGRSGRDLRRDRAAPLSRPGRRTARVRGLRGNGGAGDGGDRRRADGAATTSARSRSTTAPGPSRSASRAS